MEMLKTTIASYDGSASINLNGSTLTFFMAEAGEEPVELVVDLLEIISKYSQDHGVIAIGQKGGALVAVETTAISVGYRNSPFADTYGTTRRDSAVSVYRSVGGGAYPAMFILTPYRGCSFEECTLYFFEVTPPSNFQVTVNGQALVAQEIARLADYLNSWLPISLTGPSTVALNGSVDLTVSCPDHVEVYFEATAGVLNRSRARDGDVVHVDFSELPTGTVARVKAGYKFWPGKTDHEIEVQ